MRDMTPLFYEISHKVHFLLSFPFPFHSLTTSPAQLRTAIQSRVRDARPTEIDMLGWMGRTALELMGQAGLGYSFDPLVADAADEYGTTLKNLAYAYPSRIPSLYLHDCRPAIARARGMQQFIPVFEAIVPAGWRRTVAELIPVPALKEIIRITDTLRIRSTEIFKAKKAALLAGDEALKQQVGEGRDLISILRALPNGCELW